MKMLCIEESHMSECTNSLRECTDMLSTCAQAKAISKERIVIEFTNKVETLAAQKACDAVVKFMGKARVLDPSVDAMPVVMCKDCKHWDMNWGIVRNHCCKRLDIATDPEFFCRDGERKNA